MVLCEPAGSRTVLCEPAAPTATAVAAPAQVVAGSSQGDASTSEDTTHRVPKPNAVEEEKKKTGIDARENDGLGSIENAQNLRILRSTQSSDKEDDKEDGKERTSGGAVEEDSSYQLRLDDALENAAPETRVTDMQSTQAIHTDLVKEKIANNLKRTDSAQPNSVNIFIDEFIRSYGSRDLTAAKTMDVKDSMSSRGYAGPPASTLATPVKSDHCGGVITVSSNYHTIKSPNYPSNYPANSRCIWTVVAHKDSNYDQVKVWIQDFELEGSDCSSDSLKITDLAVGKTAVYCGAEYNETFISMGNSLALAFMSDNTINKRGFVIKVQGIKSTCGMIHKTIGNESLIFSTPNFPLTYPTDSRCHWLIVSKTEMALKLINHQNGEENSDSLLISTNLFGTYETYKQENIYLSYIFSVTFIANSFLKKIPPNPDLRPGLRFKLLPVTKTQSCDNTLTVTASSSVVINSNRYPNGYEPSSNCWWTIIYHINSSYVSSLRFVDFDIEKHANCRYDALQIIDEAIGLKKNFCGAQKNFEYVTESKELKLHFKSDSFNIHSHKGFSIYASAQDMRRDECSVERPDEDTWVIKSPSHFMDSPAYTACTITINSTTANRFSVRFNKFNLQRREPCSEGSYLSIEDKGVNRTELFCGRMGGHTFITAGNVIKLFYSSERNDVSENFQVEFRTFYDSDCGGNYELRPREGVDLHSPPLKKLEKICVWVLQGKNSLLVLDFKRVENTRVSQTGLYSDIYSYNPRTLHFIQPSDKYMILTRENNVKIQANAYATFSDCNSILHLTTAPVIVQNSGNRHCSQVVSSSNGRKVVSAIQYTLLSTTHPSACPLEVINAETAIKSTLCIKDWRNTYSVISEKLLINPIIPDDDIPSSFMVFVEPVKYVCGEIFDVKEKNIIVRSRTANARYTCVYRFLSGGNRIVLDVATGSKKALTYLSVSTDGSFHTLKQLSSMITTSLITTTEFLVVVKPFPRSVSFMFQVSRDLPVTSPCHSCLIVQAGSEGVVKSPSSHHDTTYPSGLTCNVKFDSENINRTVIMEVEYLDLPLNTSLDSLCIIKDGVSTVIDVSRLPTLNQILLIETPFSLRFVTTTANKYEGYKIRYKVNECGGIVMLNNDTAVTIQSLGYGDIYPVNMQCVWLVQTNITNISDRVKLKIVEFDIHESDSFEVFDPLYSKDPVVIFRGSAANQGIRSVGNQLKVVFTSDSRYVSSGFVFSVRAVVSGCGGDIDTGIEEEGKISTLDSFPNTDYCLFRLRPNQGRVMSISPLKESSSRQERGHSPGTSVQPTEEPDWERGTKCHAGSVVITTTGFLSDGKRYCVGDDFQAVLSTQDVLLVVRAPPLPPVEFSYRASGCGGELVVLEGSVGQLSSPNYPDVFTGPLTCAWTSRNPLFITITYLDIQPKLDSLILADLERVITVSTLQLPSYIQLDGPATVTFSGSSLGLKTGFNLQYERVEVQGVWDVAMGAPVTILGFQGNRNWISTWRVRAPTGNKGLTLRIWGAYVPSNSECSESFLLVHGETEVVQRLCGGQVMRTLHAEGRYMFLSLYSSSSLAVFVASVHVMT
nr:cubilin-like [Procambarus clarkii]